jgi:hypothetical protein
MISMIEILNEMYDFKPLKSVTGSDTQNVLTRYPMLVDFYKKYCRDCLTKCEAPSIEIVSCMIQKLSKYRRRNDES